MRRLLLTSAVGVTLGLVIVWFWFGRAHWRPAAPATVTPSASTAAATDTRKIRATLFYVAEDGLRLVGVDREVPYAESTVDQARALVEALLAPVQEPLAQAVPAGTTLLTLFVTEKGEAFVDLSAEIVAKHSGGALDELFTVYAIVNTLTVNLPAITQVQILVAGKEVETLAGHLDLRRPLAKNLQWTRPPGEPAPEGATPDDAQAPSAAPPVTVPAPPSSPTSTPGAAPPEGAPR